MIYIKSSLLFLYFQLPHAVLLRFLKDLFIEKDLINRTERLKYKLRIKYR
jgi:hypothetical protein